MICLSITEPLERRKPCLKGTSEGLNTDRNVSENNGMVNLGFNLNLLHVMQRFKKKQRNKFPSSQDCLIGLITHVKCFHI